MAMATIAIIIIIIIIIIIYNNNNHDCDGTNIIIGTRTYTKGTNCNDIIIGCPISTEEVLDAPQVTH